MWVSSKVESRSKKRWVNGTGGASNGGTPVVDARRAGATAAFAIGIYPVRYHILTTPWYDEINMTTLAESPNIEVLRLALGALDTNCYLAWCTETLEAVIIDPADSGDLISEKILEEGLKPQAIILTHGHFDHVLGLLEVKLNFDLPVFLHRHDWGLLQTAPASAQHWLGLATDPVPKPDHELAENMILPLGKHEIKVIETPGHTPGSVSLLVVENHAHTTGAETKNQLLFTGDTLFKDGVGRTDFSYSSPVDLERSLQKIFQLPADTICLPGHGEPATLGQAITGHSRITES
jgi:hydroxyacylglutathione hydrolase